MPVREGVLLVAMSMFGVIGIAYDSECGLYNTIVGSVSADRDPVAVAVFRTSAPAYVTRQLLLYHSLYLPI